MILRVRQIVWPVMLILFFCFFLLCSVETAPALRDNTIGLSHFAVLEDTAGGWLSYRLSGPSQIPPGGSGEYSIFLAPVLSDHRPHRYKWTSASWTVGKPNIGTALLCPPGWEVVKDSVRFRVRAVIHGEDEPGEWVESSETEARSPWTAVVIGKVLTAPLPNPLSMAVSFASALEAVKADSLRQEALARFAGDQYEKIPLTLRQPLVDFSQAEITFRLKRDEKFSAGSGSDFGILVKADKRTALGQYEPAYVLMVMGGAEDHPRPTESARLNISAGFEAFPDGEPSLEGIAIEDSRYVDRNPYYKKSMRFLRNGAWLLCSFSVDQVPPSARLRVTHLSSYSQNCPNDGWSPITITINDQEVVSNHSPSSHDYMVEEWPVDGLLREGRNTIRFYFDNSCTHYWLQAFSITEE